MINFNYSRWECFGNGGSLIAQLTAKRGDNTDEVEIDPFCLKDMEKSVGIISTAIEQEERIVVFGDYDVDGITATAILVRYLEGIGADVYYKLPNRIEDGYGISSDVVELLKEKGVNLIITVDNGITAYEAVATANRLGIKIVITDHHTPGERLPSADALINPKREDDDSGYETMSGAAVALCLVAGLEGCYVGDMLYEYGELAALGTVCDVMPLNPLNRTIAKAGLATLNETPCLGIDALLNVAKHGDKPITSQTLGFTIGPRLNAAGRIDDPTAALSLLLSADEEEALQLATELNDCNLQRRKEEQELLEHLKEEALRHARDPVLVLFGEGYHEGVLGLAATRLCRRYHRPTIVISTDGEQGKGSGRSVAGFSLYDALAACSHCLIGFGGHTLAAGLSIEPTRCEEFRKAINNYAKSIITDIPIPKLPMDGLITERITVEEIKALSLYEPYGQENPTPCFLIAGVNIEQVSPMKDAHSRIGFNHCGERYWASIFNRTPATLGYKAGECVDLAVELGLYTSQGNTSVSMTIKDIRRSKMGDDFVKLCKLFSAYYYGATLSEEQRRLLSPDREFVAKVFRQFEGSSAIDIANLAGTFDTKDAGKVLSSLYGLLELGLIYIKNDVLHKTINPVKRQLSESEILRGLQ